MYKICHICTYMCCESEKFNEKKKNSVPTKTTISKKDLYLEYYKFI